MPTLSPTTLTQAAYRDWLKIRPTNRFLADLDTVSRNRRLGELHADTDTSSRRNEGWLGWTAHHLSDDGRTTATGHQLAVTSSEQVSVLASQTW